MSQNPAHSSGRRPCELLSEAGGAGSQEPLAGAPGESSQRGRTLNGGVKRQAHAPSYSSPQKLVQGTDSRPVPPSPSEPGTSKRHTSVNKAQ